MGGSQGVMRIMSLSEESRFHVVASELREMRLMWRGLIFPVTFPVKVKVSSLLSALDYLHSVDRPYPGLKTIMCLHTRQY